MPETSVYPVEIQQVLLNLMQNSVEAILQATAKRVGFT